MTSIEHPRRVHLVGSLPAANTEEALQLALDTVGDRVAGYLPDGETGERGNWIGRLIERLRRHPDLVLVRDGDWSDYESTPTFRVRSGHRFASVDLDYFDALKASWAEFDKSRTELGRPDLAFQVGIPGPIDIAFAAFGFQPLRGFRYAPTFEKATVTEIERIHQLGGHEVVYQVEIPIEVEVARRFPAPLRRVGLRWLAGRILRIVARSPEGTRWGFHLCVGDMNNQAFSRLKDSAPTVLLANALAKRFPLGRRLEFVHLPFAHGDIPPTADERFYAPLEKLDLPEGVRLIAGFVHEKQATEDQLRIRDIIERRVGQRVDVAAACGLGRRQLEAARANLRLSRQLVE